jgi:hypothetical protein
MIYSTPPCKKCAAEFRQTCRKEGIPWRPREWYSQHPQVHVEAAGDAGCVDEEIAPLILALWRHGIRTDGSCQDRDGKVLIDAFGEGFLPGINVLGGPRQDWELTLKFIGEDVIPVEVLRFPRSDLPYVLQFIKGV